MENSSNAVRSGTHGSTSSKPLNPDAAAFEPSSHNFLPYRESYPDPAIHGADKFVAALPAQDKIPTAPPHIPQLQPAWHLDASKVGVLYSGHSVFVKHRKHGCISLIYEQALRNRGSHGYSFTIIDGHISASDGVGFVFGDRVPCSKNVKRLWSVFANRAGHVVQRMGPTLLRSDTPSLPPLAVGHTVSMVLDLNQFRATFQTTQTSGSSQVLGRCHVDLSPIATKVDCSRGYLCAAVTRAGMVVHLDAAPVSLLDEPPVLPPQQRITHPHQPPMSLPPRRANLLDEAALRAAHVRAEAQARHPQHALLQPDFLQSEWDAGGSGNSSITDEQLERAVRLLQQQQQQPGTTSEPWRTETVPAAPAAAPEQQQEIFETLMEGITVSVDTACLARTRDAEKLLFDLLGRSLDGGAMGGGASAAAAAAAAVAAAASTTAEGVRRQPPPSSMPRPPSASPPATSPVADKKACDNDHYDAQPAPAP